MGGLHLFTTLLLLALLTGCDSSPKLYQDQFLAFGTVVSISIWGASEEQAAEASRQIRQDFEAMHNTWHGWKEGGLLGEINQAIAEGKPITIPDEATALLERSRKLSRESEYLFNPGIGKLVALWGFHGEEWSGPPPPEADISRLLSAAPSLDTLQLQDGTLRSSNRELKIDLGGIAKGYAIDRAITQLNRLGINNAIVNTGGDLRAIGSHGERSWNIGIRSPDGGDPVAALQPQGDESIFTSGDYERMFLHQGRRYHHIINPATGWPASGTRSATVIHSDAVTADAAATALLIASPEQRARIAAQMGIQHVLIIDEEGVYHMTQAMERRLSLQQEEGLQIRILEPRS